MSCEKGVGVGCMIVLGAGMLEQIICKQVEPPLRNSGKLPREASMLACKMQNNEGKRTEQVPLVGTCCILALSTKSQQLLFTML